MDGDMIETKEKATVLIFYLSVSATAQLMTTRMFLNNNKK